MSKLEPGAVWAPGSLTASNSGKISAPALIMSGALFESSHLRVSDLATLFVSIVVLAERLVDLG